MYRKTTLVLCTIAISLGAQVHADMETLIFPAPREAAQNIDSSRSIILEAEQLLNGETQNDLRKLEDATKSIGDDILYDLDDIWDDDTEIGDECLGCGPPLTPYPTKAPIQGTNFPTKAPTASPTSCLEEKRGKFFLKFKNGLPIFRRCIWLKKQSKQRISKSCKEIASCSDGTADIPPAQVVCKNTCKTCYLIHPSTTPTQTPTYETTESPSNIKTSNPSISLKPSSQPSAAPTAHQSDQPSTAPTVCFEDGHATFYLEPDRSNPHLPVFQQCQWLKTQNNFRSICDKNTDSFDNSSISLLPAREVCMNTCDTCYLMNPSEAPSSTPSRHPSEHPSFRPTARSSSQPSIVSSVKPSYQPSEVPSAEPSPNPTSNPSSSPTSSPTVTSTVTPTATPTFKPSSRPSIDPSASPSSLPTLKPSSRPSLHPTDSPTATPSLQPSFVPSIEQSNQPSEVPSAEPSVKPTVDPTPTPTATPTSRPTSRPSIDPSVSPSSLPILKPSSRPSLYPTASPTATPSLQPSVVPSIEQSNQPSEVPSAEPSAKPTVDPTSTPTYKPSSRPTSRPSINPSASPSSLPTLAPSAVPSIRPTILPSLAPTSCSEDASALFFFGTFTSDTLIPIVQTCQWLREQRNHELICLENTESFNNGSVHLLSAREVCMNTCDTCYFMYPSETPSSTPSINPTTGPTREPSLQPSAAPTAHQSDQPSTAPTVCFEDGHATFYLEPDRSNPHLPVFQQCQWLKTQNNFRSICDKNTDSFDNSSISLLPAREVCMNTCDTCYLMNPSEAPSSTPSRHPSEHPSLFYTDLPAEKPSPLPSIRMNPPSGGPSASPTIHLSSCYEDPDKKFFLRYNKNDVPVFKQCSWLKIAKNSEDICKKRIDSCYDGKSLIGPAREVCMNTCCTCYLLNPSEAPTTAPSPSPTALHPSCPTC